MHVTADQDGEFVRQGGEWVITTRVTVRMTDAERCQMDGLRYEAYPWIRFRLKVIRALLCDGLREGHAWFYQVHDCGQGDRTVIVRSGERPTWDTAFQDGQAALLDARRAALDEDQPGSDMPTASQPSN